jgi:hypothetical protein
MLDSKRGDDQTGADFNIVRYVVLLQEAAHNVLKTFGFRICSPKFERCDFFPGFCWQSPWPSQICANEACAIPLDTDIDQ